MLWLQFGHHVVNYFPIQWGFQYLQDSSQDMVQNVIYSPWEGTIVCFNSSCKIFFILEFLKMKLLLLPFLLFTWHKMNVFLFHLTMHQLWVLFSPESDYCASSITSCSIFSSYITIFLCQQGYLNIMFLVHWIR